METDRSPTAARLRLSLVPLVRRLRQHNDEGMTANHVAALSTILRLGPVTFGELAEAEPAEGGLEIHRLIRPVK